LPILGDGRRGLVGIGALVAAAINRGGHIVVSRAVLHRRVCVAQAAYQGGVDLYIARAVCGAPKYVVAGNRGSAGGPRQRDRVGSRLPRSGESDRCWGAGGPSLKRQRLLAGYKVMSQLRSQVTTTVRRESERRWHSFRVADKPGVRFATVRKLAPLDLRGLRARIAP
jgi:hypothetical protein